MTAPETTKMTSAKFSEFVLSIDDLYNMGIRNGFYLQCAPMICISKLLIIKCDKVC